MKRWMLPGLALLIVACGDPIVGEWEEDEDQAGYSRTLTIEDDETGEMKVKFSSSGVAGLDGTLTSEVDWTAKDESYKLEINCKKSTIEMLPCGNNLDYDLDCELRGDDDELRCEGETSEGSYDIDFKKVGD